MTENKEILSQLKAKRKSLENELNKLNKAIFALEPNPPHFMEWKVRALECIEGFNTYSQTAEILNCVFINDPQILEDDVLRKRYITGLSVALNDLCKTGVIKKFRLSRVKGDFYGFPDWFTSDGSLKKEFYGPRIMQMNRDVNAMMVTKMEAGTTAYSGMA